MCLVYTNTRSGDYEVTSARPLQRLPVVDLPRDYQWSTLSNKVLEPILQGTVVFRAGHNIKNRGKMNAFSMQKVFEKRIIKLHCLQDWKVLTEIKSNICRWIRGQKGYPFLVQRSERNGKLLNKIIACKSQTANCSWI